MFYTIPHTYKTADFKVLFSEPGASRWEEVWRNTDALAVYINALNPGWGERWYPELHAAGRFLDDADLRGLGTGLRAKGIGLCIAAGAVKEWSLDAVRATAVTERILRQLNENGCSPASVCIDESLYAGLKHGRTPDDVVRAVVENYCRPVREEHADLKIGMVEPWPACAAADIASYVVRMGELGMPPAFVHIDINYPRVGRIGSIPELTSALETISHLGIPTGIIAWSSNFHGQPASSAEFCRNTMDFAAWADRHFSRFCDDHIVQSWLPYPTHCLPEHQEDTFMWLAREYGRRYAPNWERAGTGPIV